MVKIKCKIDCQAVDCKDCAKERQEYECVISNWRDDIQSETDKQELFNHLQSMRVMREHFDEWIALCETKLRELGVTLPEDEKKPASTMPSWGC